jgi:hypothetical protein
MATTIKLKRSSVAGKKPTAADLQQGEIGLNTNDGAVFIKKDDGTIVNIANTGLEVVSESGNTGWRLVGADPANYGNIGSDAVDLSRNNATSTTKGATGNLAVALGRLSTASGTGAVTMGLNSVASGDNSLTLARLAQATGNFSIAGGESLSSNKNIASGRSSFNINYANTAGLDTEVAGSFSVVLGGANNNLQASAQYSATIGGVDVVATQPRTVYVPSLVVGAGSQVGLTGEKGHLRVAADQLQFHNGTEFNRIPVVSQENTVSGEMKIAVVASMPATPDANTIYYVA